mmetsp:Transcript_4277/g.10116  ORF Transcript_4277/g.10116 Transcript_4277/m.10116 type:complete len:209 (+) Transcript_4277:716-1342(+)
MLPLVPSVPRRPRPLVVVPVLGGEPQLVDALHSLQHVEKVFGGVGGEKEHAVALLLQEKFDAPERLLPDDVAAVLHLLLGGAEEVHVEEDEAGLAGGVGGVDLARAEDVARDLLVGALDQPDAAARRPRNVLPHLHHVRADPLHVLQDVLSPPQHRVVLAPRQLLRVPVLPLVLGLAEALDDGAREVLLAPRVRADHARNHLAARREL